MPMPSFLGLPSSGLLGVLALDFSYLTLDDDLVGRDFSDTRTRLQWDVSF